MAAILLYSMLYPIADISLSVVCVYFQSMTTSTTSAR